ncbi:MAG TPA: DUF952 domain-containing protein [Chloroflexota bacterium]|jgi:uncharacterized protein (DUF952 family)|nr:DUF952 domain-containing protein [Chloroflexota bacterium]
MLVRVPPRTTYHLVPDEEWTATDPSLPYTPAAFGHDGFVHCTDGAADLAATANRFFADFQGDLLVLTLDTARLTSPVRYEDPARIYPHVYGPIERAAIIRLQRMQRDPTTGAWQPPTDIEP